VKVLWGEGDVTIQSLMKLNETEGQIAIGTIAVLVSGFRDSHTFFYAMVRCDFMQFAIIVRGVSQNGIKLSDPQCCECDTVVNKKSIVLNFL